MLTFQTSTGPIAYDERGEGDPIVLLPSGAHDHHDYDELRALVPKRFRTISLDWPGHGSSPPGHAPATAMRFADVVQELIEEAAPQGAIVVGNSVGGFAAARLAIRRPELVTGLVLIDTGGFIGRPPQVRFFCALMSNPRFLRAIYPSFSARYMRAATEADRRARDAGIATHAERSGSASGERAVAKLCLYRARSARTGGHDRRSDPAAVGTARSRDLGKGRTAAGGDDSGRHLGRVRYRARAAHERPRRCRCGARHVRGCGIRQRRNHAGTSHKRVTPRQASPLPRCTPGSR